MRMCAHKLHDIIIMKASLFLILSCSYACYSVRISTLSNSIRKTFLSSLLVVSFSSPLIIEPVYAAAQSTSKLVQPVFGLKKDRLLPCKSESNCISSSSIKSLEVSPTETLPFIVYVCKPVYNTSIYHMYYHNRHHTGF